MCDTQTAIKNEFIRMRCMCDDETRFYKLEEYLEYKCFADKLYSVFTFFDDKELQNC